MRACAHPSVSAKGIPIVVGMAYQISICLHFHGEGNPSARELWAMFEISLLVGRFPLYRLRIGCAICRWGAEWLEWVVSMSYRWDSDESAC